MLLTKKKSIISFIKRYNSEYYYDLFTADRTLCNFLSDRDENSLINNTEKSLKNSTSKNFYKYVNSIDKKQGIPKTMFLGDKYAHNGPDITKLFAEKLGKVYKNIDLSQTEVSNHVCDNFSIITFTVNKVEECIMNLDFSSSPGPDNIHSLCVKKCLINISGFVTKLIN